MEVRTDLFVLISSQNVVCGLYVNLQAAIDDGLKWLPDEPFRIEPHNVNAYQRGGRIAYRHEVGKFTYTLNAQQAERIMFLHGESRVVPWLERAGAFDIDISLRYIKFQLYPNQPFSQVVQAIHNCLMQP